MTQQLDYIMAVLAVILYRYDLHNPEVMWLRFKYLS